MSEVLEENQIDVEELTEAHSSEEEKAFLSEFEGDEPDFDPTAVSEQSQAQKLALAAGEQSAMAVLMMTEQGIKQFGHSKFAFDPDKAENFAKSAAPLLVKYGGEMPPWLAAYKEELAFVMAAGALTFGSVQQVRQLKAEDAAVEAAKEVEQEDNTDAAHQQQ